MPLYLFPKSASEASLPSFGSLLVKGPYPPSSPIHLCISHLQTNLGKVLFLSPSRQGLATPLQDFNDEWLTTNGSKGQSLALLSRIDLYYPRSIAHWLLLLSLFKPLSSSSAPLNKTVLPNLPTLIVLHEPSAYFISAEASQDQTQSDLSQYLQIITTAFSTASFLSPNHDRAIPLVLFDSHLGDLKLPIVRPVTPSRRLFMHRPESPSRQEKVEKFVEKYFEWIGSVVDESTGEAPRTPPRHGTFDIPTYERKGPFKLRLNRRVPSDDSDVQSTHVTMEWNEVKGHRQRHSAIRQTRFIFTSDQ